MKLRENILSHVLNCHTIVKLKKIPVIKLPNFRKSTLPENFKNQIFLFQHPLHPLMLLDQTCQTLTEWSGESHIISSGRGDLSINGVQVEGLNGKINNQGCQRPIRYSWKNLTNYLAFKPRYIMHRYRPGGTRYINPAFSVT